MRQFAFLLGTTSGGGSSDSFTTMQTPFGTSPVASSPTDTLTFSSADSNLVITGNSTTDTIDFSWSSTPLVATRLGIGAAAATAGYLLDATSDGSSALARLTSYGNLTSIEFRRANGTLASPTALASSDVIGKEEFFGYGATGFSSTARARISAEATEAWTDSAQGTRLVFATTKSASTTIAEALSVENDGSLKYTGGAVNTPYLNQTTPYVYRTGTGGTGPFATQGNLFIQPRTTTATSVMIYTRNSSSYNNVFAFTSSATIPAFQVHVPVPVTPTLATSSTGGSLPDNTTYYFVVVNNSVSGSSHASAEASVTTGTSGTNTNSITITMTAAKAAVSQSIYVSTTSGSYGASSLLATVVGTTYVYQGDTLSSGTPNVFPALSTSYAAELKNDDSTINGSLTVNASRNQALLHMITASHYGMSTANSGLLYSVFFGQTFYRMNTGVTGSSWKYYGIYLNSYRANAGTGFAQLNRIDSGTVSQLSSITNLYGHNSLDIYASPVSTAIYGYNSQFLMNRGTSTNVYRIAIDTPTFLTAPSTWASDTAYAASTSASPVAVKPSVSNGFYYVQYGPASTSGFAEPTWPTTKNYGLTELSWPSDTAPVSGNWKLVIDGQPTSNIAYNASAATVQTAVQAITGFSGATVAAASNGYQIQWLQTSTTVFPPRTCTYLDVDTGTTMRVLTWQTITTPAVTNSYGLYFSDQTSSSVTNKYGIYFAGTGANNGINWGTDTFLYKSTTATVAQEYNAASQNGPNYAFRKSRGTLSAPTVVSNNDDLGQILFQGYDGGSYISAAAILTELDGTAGTGDMPGRLVFYTCVDGGTTLTEALRIDKTQRLFIGGSSDTNLYRNAADQLATDDNFHLKSVGKGFGVKEGTNAKMGTAVLNAGAVTVGTTVVASGSRIFLTTQTVSGTVGFPYISGKTSGSSFTITSSSATDYSTVAWLIIDAT